MCKRFFFSCLWRQYFSRAVLHFYSITKHPQFPAKKRRKGFLNFFFNSSPVFLSFYAQLQSRHTIILRLPSVSDLGTSRLPSENTEVSTSGWKSAWHRQRSASVGRRPPRSSLTDWNPLLTHWSFGALLAAKYSRAQEIGTCPSPHTHNVTY